MLLHSVLDFVFSFLQRRSSHRVYSFTDFLWRSPGGLQDDSPARVHRAHSLTHHLRFGYRSASCLFRLSVVYMSLSWWLHKSL